MKKRTWAVSGALVAALAGYGALDAYDVVPGVLTLAPTNTPKAVTVEGKTYEPLQKAASAPLPSASVGAAPSANEVKKSVEASLKNPWFGSPTAVTVRDASTGTVLYEHDSSKATTPASVTKLASAFAIAHSELDLDKGLTTRATLEGSTVELVAGGDMTLAEGAGDATKVAGRAGLSDLAAQSAAALKKQGITKVTVDTNTSYAPGPNKAKGWEDALFDYGFTARITTLALASERADNRTPAVADPTKDAAQAFVKELGKRGITATYGKNVTTPVAGQQLGSVTSAPVLDLLGLALQDSDNSMVESLARQAAALDGVHGDSAVAGTWVTSVLKREGVDVSGVKLVDTSGLSSGTTLPVRVLGDVLTRASTGKDATYARVVERLPVSAWNGTLHDRYMRAESRDGAGLVRAKTGSLPDASSLAGLATTKSGHPLVFAVTTNGTFSDGAIGAKTAVDHLVAELTKLP